MASESETAQTQTRLIFERLVTSRNRDLSLFLPFLFGLQGSDPDENSPDPDHNSADGSDPRAPGESIVLINPFTQGMVVIEVANLNSLLRANPDKNGRPPASKASIEALPEAEIGKNEVGECAICLEGWGFGARVVKEMPCKHRFHGDCVEKWLGIHGSCPVCRFEMPFDHQEEEKKEGGERAIWVGFTLGSRNPGRSSSGDVDRRAEDEDGDSGRVDSENRVVVVLHFPSNSSQVYNYRDLELLEMFSRPYPT